MKPFYALLFLLLLSLSLKAQYNVAENNVWAMGNGAGVDFSVFPPVAIPTAMMAIEGCASVSDGNNLLFYTNGKRVWNAQGTVMPNGNDILGPGNNTLSTSQAAVIVPVPGSNRYYYLFSLTDDSRALFCNRIDMTLDNGKGDVDTGFPLRQGAIQDSLSEKMAAVPGCDHNVWLVVFKSNGKVLAYEITTAGVNLTPVVSAPGVVSYGIGVIKVSPKANRIAVCNDQQPLFNVLLLFNFDYTNGSVTFNRIVDTTRSYGCAFSPDGTKLYAFDLEGPSMKLKQFNLDMPFPGASSVALGPASGADLKLAVDGKVYFITPDISNFGRSLGCVPHPDVLGIAAGFEDHVIDLGTGYLEGGFPNEVVVAGSIPTGELSRVVEDTVLCTIPASGVALKAGPASGGYTWDDNSSGSTRIITQPGTYYVRYQTACGGRMDTFKVRDGSFHASLQFTNPALQTDAGYSHYQWYKGDTLLTGETGPVLMVGGNGWYSVVVKNQWGCRDSVSLQVTGYTAINQTEPLSLLVSIYPNPASDHFYIKAPVKTGYKLCGADGSVYREGKESVINIADLARGLYFLQVYDQRGNRITIEKVLKL